MICSGSCCTQSGSRRSTTTFASNRKRSASPHPLHPLPSFPPAIHTISPPLSPSLLRAFIQEFHSSRKLKDTFPCWHFPLHAASFTLTFPKEASSAAGLVSSPDKHQMPTLAQTHWLKSSLPLTSFLSENTPPTPHPFAVMS